MRPLVGDDAALESGLLPALSQYNLEQLIIVDIPGSEVPVRSGPPSRRSDAERERAQALICPAAQVPSHDSRFLHTHSSQLFTFDHLRLSASDFEPYRPPESEVESLRKELEAETGRYVLNHFEGGVWAVFLPIHAPTTPPTSTQAAVQEAPVPMDVDAGQATDPQSDAMEVATSAEEAGSVEVEVVEPEIGEPETGEKATAGKEQAKVEEEQAKVEEEPAPVVAEEPPPPPPPPKIFRLQFVGNKYNPANYWTGRWRSSYDVDLEAGEVKGQILVNVHYYEQGNVGPPFFWSRRAPLTGRQQVQLSTDYSPVVTLAHGPASTPSQVLKAIAKTEEAYQTRLNAAYGDLGDKAFRSLRRALPVTKAKINWARLGVYKMKADLEK